MGALSRPRARRAHLCAVDVDEVFASTNAGGAGSMLAAECVARSIARAVYEATPLKVEGALPSWRQRF